MKMFEVSHVNVNYGKSRIVTDVSFTLNDGKKMVILGRNGVGKTTLMKCLIGLLPVEGDGTLTLDEKNITKMPDYMHNKMGIGYVPQGREIIPDFTVKENLELGCLGHNEVSFKERFDVVLDYFPALKEHMNRKGGVLSGGQQQQLAIGRCLMSRPSLILLDEPTEGIQPNVVAEIASTLNRICQEMHLSIILVEQNIKFAKRIAEKFIIMQKGSAVASGDIDELTDDIAQKYLAV